MEITPSSRQKRILPSCKAGRAFLTNCKSWVLNVILTPVAILEKLGSKIFQAFQRFFTGVLLITWTLYIHAINKNLHEILKKIFKKAFVENEWPNLLAKLCF